MERYRRFLPVDRRDAARSRSARASRRSSTPAGSATSSGLREPAPEGRGPEPDRLVQGPGHGRGRGEGGGGRAHGRSSAPRPATRRRRRRPMARRPASRSSSCCPRARSRSGKLLQALVAGRAGRRDRRQLRPGARDRARARRAGRPPGHARQLGQPVPPRRPEDRGVRGLRRPRPGARRAGHPGRQRRQHQRLLGGLPRLPRRRASSARRRGCAASRRRAPRRSWTATRIEHPETVATAIRIGDPASWTKAIEARDESGGRIEAVTDEEILAAYRDLARLEGIFCEPASAACVAGVRQGGRRRRARPRCAGRVRADRSRPEGPDDRRAPGARPSSRPTPTVGSVAVALGW